MAENLSVQTNKIADEFGYWNEHPEHPVSDWKSDVQNGDTRLGYWEWVAGILSCCNNV